MCVRVLCDCVFVWVGVRLVVCCMWLRVGWCGRVFSWLVVGVTVWLVVCVVVCVLVCVCLCG